jgi:hypothetical protein
MGAATAPASTSGEKSGWKKWNEAQPMNGPINGGQKAVLALDNAAVKKLALACLVILLNGLLGGLASRFPLLGGRTALYALPVMLAGWGILGFAVVKYDWLVFLVFCAFGLVQVEPAPSDLLLMLLLAVGLIAGQLSLKPMEDSSLIHFMLWGFVVANFLSLLATPAIFITFNFRYFLITLYMIATAYFIRLYVTSQERMAVVIKGYIVSAFLTLFLVALGYVGIGTSIFITYGRARGFFKDPNVYGPFLIPVALLLIADLMRPTILRIPAGIKAAGVAALSVGIFLSFSRGALGAYLISVFVYFALDWRRMTRAQLFYLLLFGLVGGAGLFFLIFKLNLTDLLLWRSSSLLQAYDIERFSTQAEGLHLGLTRLLGIGPAMLYHAHSLYVRTFAEYGIFGLTFLMSTLLILTIRLVGRVLYGPPVVLGVPVRAVFASWAGLMLNSIIIDTLHWRHFWLLFALCWAICGAEPAPALPPLSRRWTPDQTQEAS